MCYMFIITLSYIYSNIVQVCIKKNGRIGARLKNKSKFVHEDVHVDNDNQK